MIGEFAINIVAEVMMCFGAFGLGWYLRRPPVFGRIVGVAPRSCNDV